MHGVVTQRAEKDLVGRLEFPVPKAVTGVGSELADKYHIVRLPTILLLDTDGKELNRRTGFVGELDVRNGFLNLAVVEKPPG